MSSHKESTGKTLLVALSLCLVCSLLVSSAAVLLKPKQKANALLDLKKNVLRAAGLYTKGVSVEKQFSNIEPKVINFETGSVDDSIDPISFDQRKMAKDPKTSVSIPPDKDIAGLKRRSKYGIAYFVKDGDRIKKMIFPVHGNGLWSTMYAFVAIGDDLNTIEGLNYYEQGETPGLGAEVTNPKWQQQWIGRKIFDEQGQVMAEVAKGKARAGSAHQVDGLSGATLTSNGVTNTFKYWFSSHAYGKFLENFNKLNTGEM